MGFLEISEDKLQAECKRNDIFRRCYRRIPRPARARPRESRAGQRGHGARWTKSRWMRLSRYAHRLEHSFHRCLRDLHVMKQCGQAIRGRAGEPVPG